MPQAPRMVGRCPAPCQPSCSGRHSARSPAPGSSSSLIGSLHSRCRSKGTHPVGPPPGGQFRCDGNVAQGDQWGQGLSRGEEARATPRREGSREEAKQDWRKPQAVEAEGGGGPLELASWMTLQTDWLVKGHDNQDAHFLSCTKHGFLFPTNISFQYKCAGFSAKTLVCDKEVFKPTFVHLTMACAKLHPQRRLNEQNL